MKVFAYCCADFEDATRRAAGVRPVLSPPAAAEFFGPELLSGYDLLYFDLHGRPGEPFWRGDGGIVALRAEQVRSARLGAAVVFAATCYLGDRDSPMLDAFLDAGARYVIGGEGENWGPRGGRLYGAPLLGLWFRRWMGVGFEPLMALDLAKQSIMVATLGHRAVEDTVRFRAYHRRAPVDERMVT